MSHIQKNPQARAAFFARWTQYWSHLQKGGYDPSEKDAERANLIETVTGKTSLTELDRDEFTACMISMGSALHHEGPDPWVKDPKRAAQIYKTERLLEQLRPTDPDSYAAGILKKSAPWCENWRHLPRKRLFALMTAVVDQCRRKGIRTDF